MDKADDDDDALGGSGFGFWLLRPVLATVAGRARQAARAHVQRKRHAGSVRGAGLLDFTLR